MRYYRFARSRAVDIALGEVGVTEIPAGSNTGRRVRQYQSTTALGVWNPTGWPWCAAFVNWAFNRAGRPLIELKRSASVGEMLREAQLHGWAHYGSPKRGDIVCYDWDTLNGPRHGDWPDHVGIIVKNHWDGTFTAVEGNTSVNSDSNGGAVMVRRRSRRMVEAFIRVPGEYRYSVWAGGKPRWVNKSATWMRLHPGLLPWARKRFGSANVVRIKPR